MERDEKMTNEEKLLEEYIKMFGKLPPSDEIISYYDDLYQDLLKKAVENIEEITPQTLEKAIGDKPYDLL